MPFRLGTNRIGRLVVGAAAVPFTGLLDTYGGATVAYSLRRLSGTYTGAAVEVRRSSDNATLDIGFVGEDLDTASLTAFTGAGEGYISKWYDQSGNGNNAVQSTTTLQPLIVSGGTVEQVNSKPAINFDSTDDYFDLTSNVPTAASSGWAYVLDRSASNIKQPTLAAGTNVPYGPYWFSDGNVYYAPNTSSGNGRPSGATGQNLVFLEASSSPSALTINGTNITAGNGAFSYQATNYIYLGRRNADYASGKYQELILWNSDQSSNQTGIQDNINTYYSIY